MAAVRSALARLINRRSCSSSAFMGGRGPEIRQLRPEAPRTPPLPSIHTSAPSTPLPPSTHSAAPRTQPRRQVWLRTSTEGRGLADQKDPLHIVERVVYMFWPQSEGNVENLTIVERSKRFYVCSVLLSVTSTCFMLAHHWTLRRNARAKILGG